MAKRRKVNPKGTFLKRCEVTDVSKRGPTCGGKWDTWVCGRKAVTRIKDIECNDKKPFWVCAKHKKEFLEGNHYREIPKRKR